MQCTKTERKAKAVCSVPGDPSYRSRGRRLPTASNKGLSNETPAQREERPAHNRKAQRISDEINAQLEVEKTERRKCRPDIRIFLLGKFLSSLVLSFPHFPFLKNFHTYECPSFVVPRV